ncbi:MAG: FeoB-associated Cys-rich membrane protein [Desulfovibrionaceae bacterium]|nr:FeoB-associated Cys-rich membrane protein [Desulfovibrionaceae bacterium]MBO4793049.1 FeoB-associated Cys-rich membrane protein [Deltaproteobacteria bacterium]MBR5734736.1 FeoB-associated Cys-rich membrane protein [Desulfovibrionaceae bacterium]
MEEIFVFAVIAAAAAYAVWRVIRAAKGERCCSGCKCCPSSKPDCCSSEEPRA